MTLVLPAKDEALGIERTLRSLPLRTLEAAGFAVDVLVLDGQSSDGTGDIARRWGARVLLDQEPGKGAALRNALPHLEGDYVVMMDADGSYAADAIPGLLGPLAWEEADVVMGRRRVQPGAMPRTHRFGNALLSACATLLYGRRSRDVCTGLWAFRREALESLPLRSARFGLEAELFALSSRRGLRMAQVPVDYLPRLGATKIRFARDGPRIARRLVASRFVRLPAPEPAPADAPRGSEAPAARRGPALEPVATAGKPPRQPLLRSLAMAALLLQVAVLVVPEEADAATTRSLAITNASAGPKVPFQAFDGNPPKVFDIDGDGDLEIVAQNDNQYVYVFDSQSGALLAEVKTNFPSGWSARSFNGPEVAVMSGDGKVRLVLANSAATVTSYRFDPAASSGTRFAFVKEWERRLSDCFSNPGMDSKPVLADLDRDGRFEILAATEEQGIFALRDDGRVYWKNCMGGGNAEPAVGDLDLDGWPDVVYGSDAGIVTALRGRTGATMWSYNVPAHFDVGAGSMPVGPAVGQLDGLAGPDVVVGVRDSHDATDWSRDHALLLALDSGGRLLWGRQDAEANPLTYTHAIIADADGDGESEVYWADWNTNGHKPPWDERQAWQVTGPAHFYRYDAGGNLVWRQSLGTFWSNKDLPIADADGDGVQEVLANGPAASGHDGIWHLDVRTGAKEAFVDTYPWKVQRAPVVADLEGTGQMQWVVAAAPQAASAGGHALLVYDTGQPYSSAWPHVPYPTLGTPPPPPSGTFDATFTVKSPNPWWQEVTVRPVSPRTVAEVEVRIDGGFWQPMALRSWGAWTSSYHTPAGTRVEFLATDSGGAVSQSAPFTWLDGQLTKGSVPPSDPPPTLTATFEVPAGVNEWWVEVRVTASDPLSAVHARVNSGSWTALAATGWGTWGKSFHVPAGSQVQFRATATTGAQAISPTFNWLSGSSAFTATFSPRAQDNNWWVEAEVTANRPVAAVEASVNGGAWVGLDPTDWGTWAKSLSVADGSSVRFRATSGDGDTVVSASYPWG